MGSIAIFSGSKLGDMPWKPGKKVSSLAMFGAASVDFRQAEMEEGTTNLTAVSIFGVSKAIVPRDMPVTLGGVSIFGGKRTRRSPMKEAPQAGARALHINAVSIFGAFQVTD